jgi:hypothetical protein
VNRPWTAKEKLQVAVSQIWALRDDDTAFGSSDSPVFSRTPRSFPSGSRNVLLFEL